MPLYAFSSSKISFWSLFRNGVQELTASSQKSKLAAFLYHFIIQHRNLSNTTKHKSPCTPSLICFCSTYPVTGGWKGVGGTKWGRDTTSSFLGLTAFLLPFLCKQLNTCSAMLGQKLTQQQIVRTRLFLLNYHGYRFSNQPKAK